MKAVNFEWKMDFAISWNDRKKIIQTNIQEQWDGDTIHFNTETDHT